MLLRDALRFYAKFVKVNQDKIWAHFQDPGQAGESAFLHAAARYSFLARAVAPGEQALNIGVGQGGLEKLLVTRGVLAHCLDPSATSKSAMELIVGRGNAKVGYSQAIPYPSGVFDVVIMSEVLGHLSDDIIHRSLDEVGRVLRPQGRFLGTVPADENLRSNKVICPHCGESFHRWGHEQTFSRQSLRGLLASRFTEPTITRRYFIDYTNLNWKGRLAAVFKTLAIHTGVQGDGETFAFSCKKR